MPVNKKTSRGQIKISDDAIATLAGTTVNSMIWSALPVTLNEASHKIDELTIEGNELVGDISILDTPQGKNVQALLESDIKLAFAPRMAVDIQEEKDEEGNVILDENGKPKTYIADVKLESIDIIQDCEKSFDNANIEIIDE